MQFSDWLLLNTYSLVQLPFFYFFRFWRTEGESSQVADQSFNYHFVYHLPHLICTNKMPASSPTFTNPQLLFPYHAGGKNDENKPLWIPAYIIINLPTIVTVGPFPLPTEAAIYHKYTGEDDEILVMI